MAIITFDTLAFSKTMQDAGMERTQAEALATAQREAFIQMLDARDFATSLDVHTAKSELKDEIAAVRTELKEDNANLRAELKDEIAAVRTELRQEIAQVNSKIDLLDQRTTANIQAVITLIKQMDDKIETRATATENKLIKWLLGSFVGLASLFIAISRFMH